MYQNDEITIDFIKKIQNLMNSLIMMKNISIYNNNRIFKKKKNMN